jgi:electron transfer flavoprotein alpha/beta subunit
MRILVPFKVTPDFEALRTADWARGEGGGVETRYVRRVLNCFDESALELALRVADALAGRGATAEHGATATLEALTIGGRESEPHLKTLLALGFARAVRVAAAADGEAGGDLDFAPAVIAMLIAAYAGRMGGPAFVMPGCSSGPGDSGTVPFLLAEMLGWPCLSKVTAVEALDEARLRVTCAVDDGLLSVTVRPPCVLAVGNAVVSHLRAPTLGDRLARRDRRVDVVSGEDLGVDVAAELGRAPSRLESLRMVRRARAGAVVGGATARDKARALFDAHLKGLVDKL